MYPNGMTAFFIGFFLQRLYLFNQLFGQQPVKYENLDRARLARLSGVTNESEATL